MTTIRREGFLLEPEDQRKLNEQYVMDPSAALSYLDKLLGAVDGVAAQITPSSAQFAMLLPLASLLELRDTEQAQEAARLVRRTYQLSCTQDTLPSNPAGTL